MTVKQNRDDIQAILDALKNKEDKPPAPDGALTKNVITIGVSLITATLVFCGSFIYSSNAKITEMAVQLKYVSESVTDLRKKAEDASSQFVTRNEFDKARLERTAQIADIEARTRILEAGKRK